MSLILRFVKDLSKSTLNLGGKITNSNDTIQLHLKKIENQCTGVRNEIPWTKLEVLQAYISLTAKDEPISVKKWLNLIITVSTNAISFCYLIICNITISKGM